jgi:hypothetical protein
MVNGTTATISTQEPVQRNHRAVNAEVPEPRADAARNVEWCVSDQRDEESERHHCRAFEEVVRESVAQEDDGDNQCRCNAGRDRHHFANDGSHSVAERAAVGDCTADLLFERQEEPGHQGKHHEPQGDDRFEAVLSESLLPEPEEDVNRHPADEEPRADGEASRRKR